MRKTIRAIDAVIEHSGRALSWLVIIMVLVQAAVVVMRYVFGLSLLWMQESILYLHAILFLCAAGYTLLHEGHVRIDIFYSGASSKTRAWVDIFGVCFLLFPVCFLIFWAGFPFVAASWAVLEGSMEVGGIPAVYLLKTCILVFAASLALSGFSLILRCILVLRGDSPESRFEQAPDSSSL